MKHGSLFSGIGGFDLAAEWMGWENVFHCEWNPFGQAVLNHYWPNAESYGDITKTDFTKWRGSVDIITGGFPCQPFSVAGKRRGKDDERHLWPEMLRAIREAAPQYIVGENVRGIVNWNRGMVFNEVLDDLEAIGYEVSPFLLPAYSVGGQQERYRMWFIAYSNQIPGNGVGERREENTSQWRKRKRSESRELFQLVPNGTMVEIRTREGQFIKSESALVSGVDGISYDMAGGTFLKYADEANGAFGNAIVPQVAYEIFKAIERTNSIQ